ncbi:hypothetical protein QWY75_06830 [Pontixanthobacter aestiaquae]|uniref:Uncharacterized protein n=1 Tax=Pontixanthobacter aestiaquae TaxID=1509367 RepID=A0A844Z8D3_9SPHN|nr:hypothetical protein [Pontixanthobacter aestiaquae]MDN3645916.1 hypothetical protein [Pontixanthobacter aestiaquae]MXO83090.1 hypothetical protein [Pontixanthobacter aestiaquae]
MRKLLFAIIVLVLLVGIALQTGLAKPVVQWRVESALLESGMSEKRASCMAARMVDRLSIQQLYELRQGMAPRDGETDKPDGLGDLIKRLRRGTDTETVTVVTSSAGLCAIGIG